MTYEDAVKYWAAKNYNLDVKTINRVYIDNDVGSYGGCPTCGPDYYDELDVTIYFNDDTWKSYTDARWDFATILAEIVAVVSEHEGLNNG